MNDPLVELDWLMGVVPNPDYDLVTDNFRVIESARYVNNEMRYLPHKWIVVAEDVIFDALLRLRCEYPHVFAISIGQFPEYDGGLEQYLNEKGYIDSCGFQHMCRTT